ncbi:MAG TPA: NAD(P)-dependent oxidoreductase [Solirubrobacterales bacterium]|nr:NAD(P)-dependent oxidoreductase [Solirubrobacterales bacterium]
MPDTRVLVTGATGLIGRQLVPMLSEAEVLAVSRFPQEDSEGVRWIACDLAEPGATFELVTSVKPEVVIHLAGSVRGDRSLDAVAPTLMTNLVSGVELLEAATKVGSQRIVWSGSLLEEPAEQGPLPVPPSPYGASRWAASAYARMFCALFESPVVILRPSYVYGPGQDATKLIPHTITALLDGESPHLGSGTRRLDCIYATDAARAFCDAVSAAGVEGRTIDLGSGSPRSVRSIVESIVNVIGPTHGRPIFGAVPARPLEQEVPVDIEQAAGALGWRATTGLEDGLLETVDWFRTERYEAIAAGTRD